MSKVMFITGGSRGIGAATAKLAAREGYDVGITFVDNAKAAEAVAADVQAAGRRCAIMRGDMGEPTDVARMFQELDRALGRLDAFFNNAGIFAPAAPFVDISAERLQRIAAGTGLVARTGSDDFTLMITDPADPAASRIVQAMRGIPPFRPMPPPGGIARVPGAATSLDDFLKALPATQ